MKSSRIAVLGCIVLLTVATLGGVCSADEANSDVGQGEVEPGSSPNFANVAKGLMVGVGLSAACGFRIFVPLLGMSIANMAGHLALSPGFQWIGTWPALVAFATATILEVGAYYVPWVDNVMDMAATPAAIVAGTIVTASQVGDASPMLKWSLAIIAGGGVGAVVQSGTVAMRAASTATTGGLGNFVFSTFEWIAAAVVTALAIVVPIACVLAVAWICSTMIRKIATSKRTPRDDAPIVGA